MTNDIRDIRSYTFSEEDRLFLDANIWLFIYGPLPPGPNWRSKVYSSAFRKMREARSQIHLDVLVLSEFINRYSRYLYEQLSASAKPAKFKEWRRGTAFRQAATEIADNARRIVSKCVRTDSGFEIVDIDGLLAQFAAGNTDFNDQIIADLCRRKNLIFITHDADFKGSGLAILTANSRLLGE